MDSGFQEGVTRGREEQRERRRAHGRIRGTEVWSPEGVGSRWWGAEFEA